MENSPDISFESSRHEEPIRSWAERNGFSDWALALIWIVVAFVMFQLAASVVAAVLLLATEGSQMLADPENALKIFSENLDLVFIGNSFGQILFLGIATLFVSRLHTLRSQHRSFLRFKSHDDTPQMLLMAAGLIIAAQPVIWFLGWINIQLPIPQFFEELQTSQLELIEDFLRGEHILILTLFHIGLVPAVCEEVLYRGYVMRAFEKSWGIWAAIIVSGLLFGLYHVQLTNLLPLAAIGMLLAFVTWASDSIYPAMLAHLVNNGGSVLVASYYPDSVVAEITPETMPPIWALLMGLAVSSYLIYIMYKQMQQIRGDTSDV